MSWWLKLNLFSGKTCQIYMFVCQLSIFDDNISVFVWNIRNIQLLMKQVNLCGDSTLWAPSSLKGQNLSVYRTKIPILVGNNALVGFMWLCPKIGFLTTHRYHWLWMRLAQAWRSILQCAETHHFFSPLYSGYTWILSPQTRAKISHIIIITISPIYKNIFP